MDRGSSRAVPISSSAQRMALGDAADAANLLMADALGTPAHAHRQASAIGNNFELGRGSGGAYPLAYGPDRHGQKVRAMTADVVRDPLDVGGSGSIALRAAREHARRKAAANGGGGGGVALSTHTAILDFNSKTSSAINAKQQQLQRRQSSQTALVSQKSVGAMPMNLPSPITLLYSHRLLYAQVVSYEISTLFRANTDASIAAAGDANVALDVSANAVAPNCGQEQYALTISEQYPIHCENSIVHLIPGEAAIAMPLTLTPVSMFMRLSAAAAAEYKRCAGVSAMRRKKLNMGSSKSLASSKCECCDDCGEACESIYVVCTLNNGVGCGGGGSNNYVPGLLFFLLLGEPWRVHALKPTMCSCCENGTCAEAGNPMRFGAASPCFEVLEVISNNRFVCRRVPAPMSSAPGGVPTFHPFTLYGHTRGPRTQQASQVFVNPNTATNRGEYDPDWLYWSYEEATQSASHLSIDGDFGGKEGGGGEASGDTSEKSPYDVIYRSTDPCDVGSVVPGTAAAVAETAAAAAAATATQQQQQQRAHHHYVYAYIPPATSPTQLADYVYMITKTTRDIAQQYGDSAVADALGDVDRVRYDDLTDTYLITRRSTGSSSRTRTLLHSNNGSSLSSLNFPMRRISMLMNENSAPGKLRYMTGVLNGFHWMTVRSGKNTVPLLLRDANNSGALRRTTVILPVGRWKMVEMAKLWRDALQHAVELVGLSAQYDLRVFVALFSTNRIDEVLQRCLQPQQQGSGGDSSASGGGAVSGGSNLRNEPYDVQSFAFSIENARGIGGASYPFALAFDEAASLAALLDFDARVYSSEQNVLVSRLMSSVDVVCAASEVKRYNCNAALECGCTGGSAQCPTIFCSGASRVPIPRAAYASHVDSRCNTLTLQQLPRLAISVEEDDGFSPPSSPPQATTNWSFILESHQSLPFNACDVVWIPTPAAAASATADASLQCGNGENRYMGAVVYCTKTCVAETTTTGGGHGASPPNNDGGESPTPPVVAVAHHYVELLLRRAEPLLSAPPSVLVPSPIGFNLHLHPALPPNGAKSVGGGGEASTDGADVLASQKSPMSQWLGFSPTTRSNRTTYTADTMSESILDECLYLRIPELCTTGLSEQRETHYAQLSPFEPVLEEQYAVLILDRPRGVYRFDAGILGTGTSTAILEMATAAAQRAMGTQQCAPAVISFELTRPDGTSYQTGGYPLIASLLISYC